LLKGCKRQGYDAFNGWLLKALRHQKYSLWLGGFVYRYGSRFRFPDRVVCWAWVLVADDTPNNANSKYNQETQMEPTPIFRDCPEEMESGFIPDHYA